MLAERLRQFRLARGLSLQALADRLDDGPSRATLSLYEKGKIQPSARYLRRLAEALEIRTGQLTQEPTLALQWIGFRKHSRLGVKAQQRLEARAANAAELHFRLEDDFGIGAERRWPRIPAVSDGEGAEQAANRLRHRWGWGEHAPIGDLTGAIEDLGVAVFEDSTEPDFDGLSGWASGRRPVVVLNGGMAADRRRFSLAHELGHLFLESPLEGMALERLHHRFAAALLVPAEAARRELGEKRKSLSWEELRLLKARFGLSLAAWVRRAYDLGILAEPAYRWCNMQIRQRGWHREEPGEYGAEGLPRRTLQLVLRALALGLLDEERARQLFPDLVVEPPVPSSRTRELLRLPRAERAAALERAAKAAAADYAGDPELAVWSILDDDDFQD